LVGEQFKSTSKKIFKRGELDFKQILFNQMDRTLRALVEGNYQGFVDGVEGLYIILVFTADTDSDFQEQDKKLFDELQPQQSSIDNNVMLWPDDRELMISSLGLQCAKIRLANLIRLAGKKRLLLEGRRLWDERKPGESAEPGETEPTDEELQAIVDVSIEEE